MYLSMLIGSEFDKFRLKYVTDLASFTEFLCIFQSF